MRTGNISRDGTALNQASRQQQTDRRLGNVNPGIAKLRGIIDTFDWWLQISRTAGTSVPQIAATPVQSFNTLIGRTGNNDFWEVAA